ncbi:hypothetical protein KUTeg_008059 [Tegillarca granosa]|uniref:DDE Tnp4 domain-containing protein n=1 Tax=Tegillarca granosa TaxID=220873 RepID=A0ABQ9FCU8_TEGGR|nr:hypothetical protein KUTeg_008059 [Tegillarca granosa]
MASPIDGVIYRQFTDTICTTPVWEIHGPYTIPSDHHSFKVYATGSYYRLVGNSFGISVASVARCVDRVSLALCYITRQFITFLVGRECSEIKRCFHDIAEEKVFINADRFFFMTPYLVTDTQPKVSFNKALCKTRILIEQTFGILKRRFPCVKLGLRVESRKCTKVVIACAVLHNIGIIRGDIIQSDLEDIIEENNFEIPLLRAAEGDAF